MTIKVGCCGFPLGLEKYAQKLKVVEVQKTFYRLPRETTLKGWREKVPEDFEFVIKAPQTITHPPSSPTYRKAGLKIEEAKKAKYGFFKPTSEVFEEFEKTLKAARILKAKVIIFQTPAKFNETPENIENLRKFFSKIPRNDNFLLGWEPRGNWKEETLLNIFKELNIFHIVDPFKDRWLYGNIRYFRLHGRGKGYRYSYSDEELLQLKEIVQSREIETYVMFNNTDMLKNALRFSELIGL